MKIAWMMFALGMATTAWAQFPPSGEKLDLAWIGEPTAMVQAHNYGGIIYPAQDYLKDHPHSWGARWYLAGAYYAKGQIFVEANENALEAYAILLKDMPQRADLIASVHYWRGRCYLAKEDYTGAYQAFTNCFGAGDLQQIKSENPELYAAMSAVQSGNFEAALPWLATYVAGTSNPPNKGTGLLWKSRALRGLGRKEAALAAIEASAAQTLTTYRSLPPEVLVQRAECWADSGDKERALQDLDAIRKADSDRTSFSKEEKRVREQARILREKLQPTPAIAPGENPPKPGG